LSCFRRPTACAGRSGPKEEVIQAAMDFAWVGQERISQGQRWSP
jgi:hypothetical protein